MAERIGEEMKCDYCLKEAKVYIKFKDGREGQACVGCAAKFGRQLLQWRAITNLERGLLRAADHHNVMAKIENENKSS